MSESKEERSKRIGENFEGALPRIIQRAKENGEKQKKEYIAKVQIKFHEAIKKRIAKTSYSSWFSDLSIGDITNDDSTIVFITSSIEKQDWLTTRYKQVTISTLESITNMYYDVVFIAIEESMIDNLEGKTLDELFELSFGTEELERKKELLRQRKLKPDYQEGLLNITECVLCGGTEVKNEILDVAVEDEDIVSVRLNGARCQNPKCQEEYYSGKGIRLIEEFRELIKRKTLIGRIKPMHLQSEGYQRESAKAARDEADGDEL